MVPSPAMCERLGLISHAQQFDLYDSEGATRKHLPYP